LLHGHDDVHFNPGRVACRKAPRTRKHGEDDRCASLRRARAEVHARGGRETLRLLCAWSWRAKRADESERRVGPKRTQRCRVRASCVCATWWLVCDSGHVGRSVATHREGGTSFVAPHRQAFGQWRQPPAKKARKVPYGSTGASPESFACSAATSQAVAQSWPVMSRT
jgi:hypothetical protein